MIENNATIKLPELLVPAGNLDKFRSALLYGANAVYLGGASGNLRAGSGGLNKAELRMAVREATTKKVSVFYCLNSFPFENDLTYLPGAIEEAAECGVSAFIVADPGLLRLARKYAPQIPVHLSTQANTTNSAAVKFWLDQGVRRVNLARELDCAQMAAIRENCPEAELEVFVHGAMCLAVSGQCLLSAWLNNRPANQGQCTQPCRFEYKAFDMSESRGMHDGSELATGDGDARFRQPDSPELTVEEALRPGKPIWRVARNEGYSSFWAPEDLCLLPYLPWFIGSGINALKIEGRMKSASYVAHVTDVYSCALKAAAVLFPPGKESSASRATDGTGRKKDISGSSPSPLDLQFDYLPFLTELLKNSSRPLTSGFFLPEQRQDICQSALDAGLSYTPGKQSSVLARVLEPAGSDGTSWVIDVKENWSADAAAELMLPGLKRPLLPAGSCSFENHRGESSAQVACGTRAVLHLDQNLGSEARQHLADIEPGIFIRRYL